uniref:Uncharacterized protein n=1 Tax=Aegilops tauschii subsp. strangulata TaxID=200361 RepID=A0A453A9M6_AEGTS
VSLMCSQKNEWVKIFATLMCRMTYPWLGTDYFFANHALLHKVVHFIISLCYT